MKIDPFEEVAEIRERYDRLIARDEFIRRQMRQFVSWIEPVGDEAVLTWHTTVEPWIELVVSNERARI